MFLHQLLYYNLLNHFLIAVTLSLTVYFTLNKLNYNKLQIILLAFIPIIIELLLPGNLYWLQNIYFTDQAVILPFALIVFLEIIQDFIKPNNFIKILYGLVMFFGVLIDWLFIFIVFVLFFKRLITGKLGKGFKDFCINTIKFGLPGIVSIILFVIQIASLDGFSKLLSRFELRTGMTENVLLTGKTFWGEFWMQHMSLNYGGTSTALLWISLICILFLLIYKLINKLRKKETNRRITTFTTLMCLYLIPCFIQVYTFRDHSMIHDFSTLKFSLSLAVIPFVLLPLTLMELCKLDLCNDFVITFENVFFSLKSKKMPLQISLIVLLLLVSSSFYTYRLFRNYRQLFPITYDYSKEYFINQHTDHNDIVFSQDWSIPVNPPQNIVLSDKRVYQVSTISEIQQYVKDIKENYTINICATESSLSLLSPDFQLLTNNSYDVIKEGKYYIYKISKDEFIKLTQQ